MGMSPESPLSSSPGALSTSPTSGLGIALGDGKFSTEREGVLL